MNTTKTFGLLLLTILIQVIINYSFAENLTIGILPTLVFGALWNLKNGYLIYTPVKSHKPSLVKFRVLTFLAIFYLIAYMTLLNVYVWPPLLDNLEQDRTNFLIVSGVTVIIPLYLAYYNIDFVARGLVEYYQSEHSKLKIYLSLIIFPIGLLWIQPKINKMGQNRPPTANNA